MSCGECPPNYLSSGDEAGHVQQFGGFNCFISGPPHSTQAVILVSDVFGNFSFYLSTLLYTTTPLLPLQIICTDFKSTFPKKITMKYDLGLFLCFQILCLKFS